MYVQCRGNAHIHTNTHTCLTLGIVKQGENVLGARCNNNIHARRQNNTKCNFETV